MLLKIAGGTVHDPTNNVDGAIKDVWIRDGKVVAPPADPDVHPDKTIDAAGLVVILALALSALGAPRRQR